MIISSPIFCDCRKSRFATILEIIYDVSKYSKCFILPCRSLGLLVTFRSLPKAGLSEQHLSS